MRNPYKLFKELVPDAPLEVGEVVYIDNGVCKIELPGGGFVTARGEATVGDTVFVRDGVIEGQSPTLETVIINV